MKILAIDTSTKMGSIALTEEGQVIAERNLNVEITHAEKLLPAIETLLKQTHQGLSQLEGLGVSIGPGSFTGLRIGLATMKGFAQALKLPLVGVSSLLALAYNGCQSEKPVVACLDANRAEVYAAVYQFSKDRTIVKNIIKEQAIRPEVLCDALENLWPFWMLGDGAVRYRELFQTRLGEASFFPPDALMKIEAKWVAYLARLKLKRGEGKGWQSLTPNYGVNSSSKSSGYLLQRHVNR